MKVAFRADASHRMGTGHVRRMKSLAQAFAEKGDECLFISRDLGIDYGLILDDAGFEVRILPPGEDGWNAATDSPPHAAWAGVGGEQDATETVAALQMDKPDWVVVDHYSFDARWHRHVHDELKAPVCAVDDMADRMLDCAVVVDHNFSEDHDSKYAGKLRGRPRILGGPEYALLAPVYAGAARYQYQSDVSSIGIFIGGTDIDDVASAVLDALEEIAFSGNIELVTTSASPHIERLKKRAGRSPALTLSVDLPDLVAFFARHDLQIGGGGGATWERCCIGAPTLGLLIAENQKPVLEPLASMIILEAIDFRSQSDQLSNTIQALINDPGKREILSERASRLVDGKGAARVADFLRSYDR